MRSGTYEYQSEFARKYVAQGREEGHLEGERRALLTVLEARGLTLEGAARQRVLACTDLSQLERWLSQAVTVQSVQELFKPKPRSKPAARAVGGRMKARKPRSME